MVGIAAFFGGYTMPGESMVQVSDPRSAERMRVEAFRREVERRGALHNGISRYSHGTMALMVQSTACMALHHVTERCCRWLLWRRADKHRGIVLRDDFRPSFGKEDAGDLGPELIDTTDLKVVEGDAIDGSRWTCDDFETHPVPPVRKWHSARRRTTSYRRLRKDVNEKCKQADT